MMTDLQSHPQNPKTVEQTPASASNDRYVSVQSSPYVCSTDKLCYFGANCTNQNPHHHGAYSHPQGYQKLKILNYVRTQPEMSNPTNKTPCSVSNCANMSRMHLDRRFHPEGVWKQTTKLKPNPDDIKEWQKNAVYTLTADKPMCPFGILCTKLSTGRHATTQRHPLIRF